MTRKLTDKQKIFCEEYIVTLEGKKSAVAAGYAEKTANVVACQLLQKPHVAAYIDELMSARIKRTQIDQDYVINTIVETVERCKQAEPVKDKHGNPTGEYTFQAGQVLKGAELLGKHLKMFTDVSEHKFELNEMGRVMIQDSSGNEMPLEFNIGKEPDEITKH